MIVIDNNGKKYNLTVNKTNYEFFPTLSYEESVIEGGYRVNEVTKRWLDVTIKVDNTKSNYDNIVKILKFDINDRLIFRQGNMVVNGARIKTINLEPDDMSGIELVIGYKEAYFTILWNYWKH